MKRALSRAMLAQLRALRDKQERYTADAFLIEGIKLLDEALRCSFPLKQVFLSADLPAETRFEIQTLCEQRQIPTGTITREEISQITAMNNPEGVLAVGQLSACLAPNDHSDLPTIYLWQVNDPGNLGTIIRTALWFGVRNIWLSPSSADAFNLKVVRGTMGALFRVKLRLGVDSNKLLASVAEQKAYLWAADIGGKAPVSPNSSNWIIAFGSESHGLPAEIKQSATSIIGIPKFGEGESLNLGVAVGIILHNIKTLERA